MINKAIAHITEQAMELNHPFATFIEEHLTEICTNQTIAAKLLNTEKKLKEFVSSVEKEMREEARKNGAGKQSAGRSDAEFFQRAESFYGIDDSDKHKERKKVDVIDITNLL